MAGDQLISCNQALASIAGTDSSADSFLKPLVRGDGLVCVSYQIQTHTHNNNYPMVSINNEHNRAVHITLFTLSNWYAPTTGQGPCCTDNGVVMMISPHSSLLVVIKNFIIYYDIAKLSAAAKTLH